MNPLLEQTFLSYFKVMFMFKHHQYEQGHRIRASLMNKIFFLRNSEPNALIIVIFFTINANTKSELIHVQNVLLFPILY